MKVKEIITQRIISELEKGKIPWKQPWLSEFPKNLISKKEYQGINFFLLSMLKYKNPSFLTYNQAFGLGGNVKKGEKGHQIVYWKMIVDKYNKGKDEKEILTPFLRYYTVFNIEQCKNIPLPKSNNNNKKIKNYEDIVKLYKNKPKIVCDKIRAYYNQRKDEIGIPSLDQFRGSKDYYAVLYHELIHSTGFKMRLNRFKTNSNNIFDKKSYSKEELIAELGSAFLCAKVKIDNRQVKQSAGYIRSWIKVLNNDTGIIISAAGKAQKAVNYILGKKVD